MPKKTAKLFAVVQIEKEIQFSKKNRVLSTDLVWLDMPYNADLVFARSLEEVVEMLESSDLVSRAIVFELATEAAAYIRGGVEVESAKA